MKILGYEFGFKKAEHISNKQPSNAVYQDNLSWGHSYPIINKKWDGEKTLGELGNVVRNIPDFERLRLRSYDAYATIDTVKIIASKFFHWTIGTGLKLQSEPNTKVLKSEGINNTDEQYIEFQQLVEARFFVYANSKECDYKKEKVLGEIALDGYQEEFLGGDCLVIIRYDDNGPNIQLVSGEHICDPSVDSEFYGYAEEKGNYVKHGIEVNSLGTQVAYYIKVKQLDGSITTERIEAYGKKSKKRLAWMLSGNKISQDHLRSVPAMSQSLEKINKLDRYTEAAVTKAEQAAKIVYAIEHQEYSTGEGFLDQKARNIKNGTQSEPIDGNHALADGLANRITETTSGQTFNMTQGSSLKSFGTEIETSFAEFHSTVFKSISAGVDVPSEVAMQEYNSNYSASRAAINSFGYIIDVKRNKFALNFYIPFYQHWLEWQILSNKIIAPGYIENIDNFMVTKSYSQCRFTGKNMPHIDPLKEAKAVELMLALDLISREQATENLGEGQWDENYKKKLEEDKLFPKDDISSSVTKVDTKSNTNTNGKN